MNFTDKLDQFEGKRFLVTGGAGFLGSHLCDLLLSKGAQVIAMDDYITGRRENLAPLLRNPSFELVEQNIIHPCNLKGELAGIFHLASPASPVDYAKHPLETLRVGAMGADNVLSLATRKDCPVLIASTSEVYGDPLEHPQKESYWGNVNPIGPRGCYDESKRYQEALAMACHRVHGTSVRIARIFNTYGPKMRANDGRVVPNLCLQALRGEPLTVYGNGRQTRSFCYVDDLIAGLARLFLTEHHEPVNLGNPAEFTILDFARKVIELTESKSTIAHHPLPVDDPKVRCPDISKAKRLLGWQPCVSFDQGLAKTIEYFRNELHGDIHAGAGNAKRGSAAIMAGSNGDV